MITEDKVTNFFSNTIVSHEVFVTRIAPLPRSGVKYKRVYRFFVTTSNNNLIVQGTPTQQPCTAIRAWLHCKRGPITMQKRPDYNAKETWLHNERIRGAIHYHCSSNSTYYIERKPQPRSGDRYKPRVTTLGEWQPSHKIRIVPPKPQARRALTAEGWEKSNARGEDTPSGAKRTLPNRMEGNRHCERNDTKKCGRFTSSASLETNYHFHDI